MENTSCKLKGSPKCAPTIANLTMGDFEDRHVYTYHIQQLVWYRFIDDIFMIWTHGPVALNTFIQHLNSAHRTIKFTHDISNTQISFIDILIKKDENGVLYTDLYTKATDTHSYLHYGSQTATNMWSLQSTTDDMQNLQQRP